MAGQGKLQETVESHGPFDQSQRCSSFYNSPLDVFLTIEILLKGLYLIVVIDASVHYLLWTYLFLLFLGSLTGLGFTKTQ